MIKQLKVNLKTAGATLTLAEMGDVVCNAAGAIDITLPTPKNGLWYRVSNVSNELVSIVYDSTTVTTLKVTEQSLLMANEGTGWWMSKGGGAMTKAEIEAVLVGTITTHNHAVDFIDLGDCPASLSGQAGRAVKVKADETGLEFGSAGGAAYLNAAIYTNAVELTEASATFAIGIAQYDEVNDIIMVFEGGVYLTKGTDFTCTSTTATKASGTWADETQFDIVVIKKDIAPTPNSFIGLQDVPDSYVDLAGKIPVVKATEDGLDFVAVPAAGNGMVIGGTTGQFYKKKSSADFDAEWVSVPGYLASLWGVWDNLTADNASAVYEQVGTTVTVTLANHGYIAGHVIYADVTTGTAVDGLYTITGVTTHTFTYTAGTSLTTSGNVTLLRRALKNSVGIHSITYPNSVGKAVVNFAQELNSAFYGFFSNVCQNTAATDAGAVSASSPADVTSKSIYLVSEDVDGGYINYPLWTLMVMGGI